MFTQELQNNKYKAGELLGLGSCLLSAAELKCVLPNPTETSAAKKIMLHNNKAEISIKQTFEGAWDYFRETLNKPSIQNTKFQVFFSLSFTPLQFSPLRKQMHVLFFQDLSLKKGFITVSSLVSLTLFFDDSSECSAIWEKKQISQLN